MDGSVQQPDVADGRAVGGRGEDVVEVPAAGARDGGEDVRGDESRVHDEQVAGADQHVSDEAENTGLLELPQVHAGDADEGKDSHQDLQRAADSHLGGGDGGGVQVGGLIWTPMNSSPAATAAKPAARFRFLAVTVMTRP